jgi:ubiquinone biosynthesis protein
MAVSLKPEHLSRYKDLAVLLFKYGRGDLVQHAGLDDLMPEETGDVRATPEAAELADDLERLGPTFIKLGQLLSTRPDVIPPAYAQALERLQDRCEPFPFEEVERIVAEEISVRPSRAFRSVDPVPIAAASIAQVHYAVLHDGREVALKVQRPGIRERVLDDLAAIGDVAAFIDEHTDIGRRIGAVLLYEEFRKSLLRELDFRQEALHMLTLAENLKDIPEVYVPQPLTAFSSSRLLTMEFVPGVKVTALSPLAHLELDGGRLADALFRAYMKQILRDGLFHADPHPGNVFLAGDRIALIDLGMVAHVAPSMQDRLLQLLLAVSENKADEAAKALLLLGECLEDTDTAGFQRSVTDLLAQHREMAVQRPQVGRAVLMLIKAGAEHGVRMPPELAMIGKTLLNLDEIGLTLAPNFDTNAAIRRHAAEITEKQMLRDLSPGSLFSTVVEMKNFVQHLPGRVNRILDRLADNDFEVKVDAIDEVRLMEGMQKVANRITLGLVLAALIVGAALLMGVDTPFKLFGYPGLAIMLFLTAAAGGICLMVSILMTDIRSRRRNRA